MTWCSTTCHSLSKPARRSEFADVRDLRKTTYHDASIRSCALSSNSLFVQCRRCRSHLGGWIILFPASHCLLGPDSPLGQAPASHVVCPSSSSDLRSSISSSRDWLRQVFDDADTLPDLGARTRVDLDLWCDCCRNNVQNVRTGFVICGWTGTPSPRAFIFSVENAVCKDSYRRLMSGQ